MANGPIVAPSTWVNGTIFTPSWGNNVQDTINAYFNAGFTLFDDFIKATPDAEIWTLTSSGGAANPTIANENANGGTGAVHPLTAGSGTSSIISTSGFQIGTKDFGFSTRVRVLLGGDVVNLGTYISNNAINFVGSATVRMVTGATNWFAVIGGAATDTGVAWSSTYQQLTCFRTGGTIYFYINNNLVYSTAHSADMGAPTLQSKCSFSTNNGSMYNDTLRVWFSR